MLNIVVLNGGRGAAALIPALLSRQSLNVTSIVNAYDDGKSTGEIRRFFNMLGPSDIRKVQELMLPDQDRARDPSRDLFALRFQEAASRDSILADMLAFANGAASLAGIHLVEERVAGAVRAFVHEFVSGLEVIEKAQGARFQFGDCSLMNCLYAGAYLVCRRDMELTTRTMDRLFRLKGTVLPNSVENKWLAAIRRNGEILYSEAEIVELRSNVLIDHIYLLEQPLDRQRFATLSGDEQRHYLSRHHAAPSASQGVKLALEQADVIIYAAGTQHSSLYPTYMSRGIAETIAANREAVKVFVTNIGADYETPTYRASDYVKGAYKHLRLSENGRQYAMEDLFSAILINNQHRKADETYVEFDEQNFADVSVRRIVDDFESSSSPGKHDGDQVIDTVLALYDEASDQR
jgi:2-phospho-L-lactate transferase/gluconeogenesis factor (CofD/UPF0052 family)